MSTAHAARATGTNPVVSGPLRLYLWTVSSAALGLVVSGSIVHLDLIIASWRYLVLWTVLLAIGSLLPVPLWQRTKLGVELPVAVGAALLFTPAQVALVTFLGSWDIREMRGGISFTKTLFNRSQATLADVAGAVVVRSLSQTPPEGTLLLPLALVCLACILVCNYGLVAIALRIEYSLRIVDAIKRLVPKDKRDFVITIAAWGILGAMLVALYRDVHPLLILLFVFPMLLGRELLSRSQMYVDVADAYRLRGLALMELAERVQQERSDERRLIAGDLHDEVLQPLFRVTLTAHVIERDLATGRLFELETDLPDLLEASDAAMDALRDLIGDLRRSTLGRGGLGPALSRLVRTLNLEGDIEISGRVEKVAASAQQELALYQIAKEALTNAVLHSHASAIQVELREDVDGLFLEVRDDGVGFDVTEEKEGHYGLHIMKERAAAVGGECYIDSRHGAGSSVRVHFPVRRLRSM